MLKDRNFNVAFLFLIPTVAGGSFGAHNLNAVNGDGSHRIRHQRHKNQQLGARSATTTFAEATDSNVLAKAAAVTSSEFDKSPVAKGGGNKLLFLTSFKSNVICTDREPKDDDQTAILRRESEHRQYQFVVG